MMGLPVQNSTAVLRSLQILNQEHELLGNTHRHFLCDTSRIFQLLIELILMQRTLKINIIFMFNLDLGYVCQTHDIMGYIIYFVRCIIYLVCKLQATYCYCKKHETRLLE